MLNQENLQLSKGLQTTHGPVAILKICENILSR